MIEIVIKLVPFEEKEVLRHLMQFYLYDFSEFAGFDVNRHGRYEYKFFDHYWTEAGRFPYFIMVDQQYAGFALVNRHGVLLAEGHSIAEFFVMRKYRRRGIGEAAARHVFAQHRGDWEVRVAESNGGARAFWRQVISGYTKGRFDERAMRGDSWRGTIFLFNNEDEAG